MVNEIQSMIDCMNSIISIMLSIRYNYYMTNNWIFSNVCAVIKKIIIMNRPYIIIIYLSI